MEDQLPRTVTLKRRDISYELAIHQVNTTNLKRVFKVDPASAWLRDNIDGTIYFPEDGSFNLNDIGQFVTLDVEGTEIRVPTLASSSAVSVDNANTSTRPPIFKSVIAPKKGTTHSIKVVKATMLKKGKGKPFFESNTTMYVEVTADKANLDHISEAIRQHWGEDYTLVTNDGMELEDSPATRGLGFWKAPSRKLYAVKLHNKRKRDHSSDDSDGDFLPPRSLRKERNAYVSDRKVDTLLEKVEEVQNTLQTIMEVNSHSHLPLGLKKVLQDTFKCNICTQTPVRSPMIITKCCKSILGCSECVNTWYSGDDALTKACPRCRDVRGYNETMILKGMDGFLEAIQKIEGE